MIKYNNYNEKERHQVDMSQIHITEGERSALFAHLERLIANGRDLSEESRANMLLQLLTRSDTPDRVTK
jgi:hypothetical protein